MNPGWRILDCSDVEGRIRYSRGQLRFQVDNTGEEVSVALAQICIILIGTKVSLSGGVLTKLSELDIALLVVDWRGVPVAGASPWNTHTRIGARQRAQASLSVPRRKQAWTQIVKAKIKGQAHVVEAVGGKNMSSLIKMARSVRSGDPENVEAQAARLYWSCFGRESRFHRFPGKGFDTWNSALDYGYTLLRGIGIRSVASAGLSGTLGVFHRGRSNAFALVDDLLEPFRPFVDEIVFSQIEEHEVFGKRHKQQLAALLNCHPFDAEGRTVPTVFQDFAQQYGLYVEDDLERISPPQWKGSLNASEGE